MTSTAASKPSLVLYTESVGSGLGRVATELAGALEASGLEITFIAPRQPIEPKVTRRAIIALWPAQRGLAKLLALARVSIEGAKVLMRTTRRQDIILFVHIGTLLPISILPVVAMKLLGRRVALNLHDFYPHTLRYPKPLQFVERALYRFIYRRFLIVFPMTAPQRTRLIRDAHVDPNRIAIIQHGPFVYEDVRPPEPDQQLTVLVFGSLRPNKRILDSIKAVAVLREAGLEVRLRIAGAPRWEDQDYWKICLTALPSDHSRYEISAGFVAEEDMARILSGVDAALCPYDEFDSQSGVALMAMSNGLSLIATPAASIEGPDVIAGAITTISTPPDTHAIRAAILEFCCTPRPERIELAGRAKSCILSHFGWDAAANTIKAELMRRGAYAAHWSAT